MKLQVFLASSLRRYVSAYDPQAGLSLSLPAGKTVHDLLAQLGIEPKEVAIVLLNQDRVGPDRVLRENDQVRLFPPLSGG